MADRDQLNANYGYPRKLAYPMGIRGGGPPGSRYPNPSTAYGGALSSIPPRPFTSSPDFRGAAGQILSAADALSAVKASRVIPRHAACAEVAASTARGSLWAPSANFHFDARPREWGQPYEGEDERFPCWRFDHPVGDELPRASVCEIAALDGLRSPRLPPALRFSAPVEDNSRPAAPAAPPATDALKPTPPPWESLESFAKGQLGGSAEARRARTEKAVDISGFKGCPFARCQTHGAEGIGAGWMKQHLLLHVQLATEGQMEDDYVKSSVAVLLHDMCMDVEVPPSQRMLERQRMARALLKPSKGGIGLQAALVETRITGKNDNPLVRRCAYDLAYGGCKGLGRPEAIWRCNKCRSWFHASCGQMGLGDAITNDKARDEALCRACSRVTVGSTGKEPGSSVQKQLALIRSKREKMLTLLERELDNGWPEGVFDLTISTEAGAIRNARGPDGNLAAESSGADARGLSAPPCAAEGCERRSRPDSRYCSDGCGVRNAQLLLSGALRHSLEERLGRERGRRLGELREMKARKQEVGTTMKKLYLPRPPVLRRQEAAKLHTIVEKRRRLWKRLLDIGAYWETVTGSRSLSVGRAYWQQQQAAEARAAAVLQRTAGTGDGGVREGGDGGSNSRGGDVGNGGGLTANGGKGVALKAKVSTTPSAGLRVGEIDAGDDGQGDGKTKRAEDRSRASQTSTAAANTNAAKAEASSKTDANWRRSGAVPGDTAGAEGETDVDVGVDSDKTSQASRSTPKISDRSGAPQAMVNACRGEGDGAPLNGQRGKAARTASSSNCVADASGDPSSAELATEASPAKKMKKSSCLAQGDTHEKSGPPQPPGSPPPNIPRYGMEHVTCVYCGEETFPDVTDHLEECYCQAAALRNKRLESAIFRPTLERHCPPPGASATTKSRTGVFGPILPSDTAVAVGRQLLSRSISYADFDDLPDPRVFQLHGDLKGWASSPSRLDFLCKELVRQRNAAIQELHGIDEEEAALEMHLRHDWMEINILGFASRRNPRVAD